ncbi:MAG: hypothetical protein KDA44_18320 [Planctomycetales bacterium]|nr:hypothetical protein [Planctomycetales bacterium]
MKAFPSRFPGRFGGLLGLAPAIAIATLLTGCSDPAVERVPTYPVSGTLTHQGRPATGAFVTLHPTTPLANAPTPRGSVAPDGTLRVSTYTANDGAPAGDYVMTVEWYKPTNQGGELIPGPNVIPRKFASPKTSQLRVSVVERENVIPAIRL